MSSHRLLAPWGLANAETEKSHNLLSVYLKEFGKAKFFLFFNFHSFVVHYIRTTVSPPPTPPSPPPASPLLEINVVSSVSLKQQTSTKSWLAGNIQTHMA